MYLKLIDWQGPPWHERQYNSNSKIVQYPPPKKKIYKENNIAIFEEKTLDNPHKLQSSDPLFGS
jgi:hypothetical protein